jgi:mono/diheme cytochrome c family protein
MKRRHGLYVIPALALAALLAGCWGSDKSTSLDLIQSGDVVATAAAVGIDKCHNCHGDSAVNAVRIFDDWASSRHANFDNTFDPYDNSVGNTNPYHGLLPYSGYEPVPDGDCTPCHDPNGDSLKLASYSGPGSSTTPRWVIGCEACHGGGERHFGVGPIGGPTSAAYAVAATTGQSSQYNTCTKCHQETPTEHSTKLYRLISDTHFDNAARTVGTDIQGYVVRKGANSACVDCHNPHTANLAINRQWKSSGHGDFTAEAWKHYRWTDASRASCQRCHTATGAMNYLTDPANYNSANNVYSWKSTTATDNRSEMLYCYACHTNYYGGLRTPGVITASYTGVSPEPTFPDAKGSNICLSCHTGRESGDSVKAITGGFDNLTFINSHYLTAGGTVFAVTGYEYAGRDYEAVRILAHDQGDKHDLIGMGVVTGDGPFDAVRQNYVNGPCVSCHFGSRDPNGLSVLTKASDNTLSHSLSPLTRYADNDLALNPVCVVCHTTRGEGTNAAIAWLGDDATAATLTGTTHKARYQAALEALKVQLALKGYVFTTAYPYFATKNWLSAGDTDTTGNTTGKNNMGAAFNYNLMKHDPGGVVHNRRYTRRLIYDAIDWIDDGVLNYSVSTTLNALDGGTEVYKTSAIAYILQSSTGTSADRY